MKLKIKHFKFRKKSLNGNEKNRIHFLLSIVFVFFHHLGNLIKKFVSNKIYINKNFFTYNNYYLCFIDSFNPLILILISHLRKLIF